MTRRAWLAALVGVIGLAGSAPVRQQVSADGRRVTFRRAGRTYEVWAAEGDAPLSAEELAQAERMAQAFFGSEQQVSGGR